MHDDALADAGLSPEAFATRLRATMRGAAARHAGQVLLRDFDEVDPRRYGWGTTVQLVDEAGVYLTVWFDEGDRDVLAFGDLPVREWFFEEPGSVERCLVGVQDLVDDLVVGCRQAARASALERQAKAQASEGRWWRAWARKHGWLRRSARACPRCRSELVHPVVVTGLETWGAPFRAPVDFDGPAFGCLACGEQWGRWGDEYADGR